LDSGLHTAQLLYRQEKELTTQLFGMIPSKVLRAVLELFTIRWFWGIDPYFEPWMTREMLGVSKFTSHEFDYLADRFTRQIAYHGLHEVGQMMVDQQTEDMGCTVVALANRGSWVIGRNFDFEAGRIFDSEKIMKWVFPEKGYAFVSTIWAGMVGAVTGVNEKGVYISLNAAGSREMRRYGTPSTLVLLKALQFSKTAEEAVQIIQNETMFITDIFVVADRHSSQLYRIEKSPRHTEVIPLSESAVVTNHLLSPHWREDKINLFRKSELTSEARAARGEKLVLALKSRKFTDSKKIERGILEILRDKGESPKGRSPSLGNRRAIDAQIATHSVIFNAAENLLFVSQGPGVSGPFQGFDLSASFKTGTPVPVRKLARDPLVSDEVFQEVRAAAKTISQVHRAIVKHDCVQAGQMLDTFRASSLFNKVESYSYYVVLGDYRKCIGDQQGAKVAWKKALDLVPAYPGEVRSLEEKLRK
jgi:predicted choloylglycine hydrolase